MRNISWCPCLNTRLNPNPRINNADRAVVKCKEVWAFTKECHTYFYHSSVHCQGINIPIAISNILFFGKIGGTLWRKIRNTFLQKIPVPMMTRVPVVCAVWCCDVCTAGGTQLRGWQIMGHHPGLHNMDWIPMWEPAHAAPSAPLGDTQVFLCPKLCDTLCFYRENMNHKAPIAFAVSIIHLIWPVKFDIYHNISHALH